MIRVAVESLRGDYRAAEFVAFLTPGQLISILTLAIGLALFQWLPRSRRAVGPPNV